MSDWDDFVMISPVFLLMGITCIVAYIAPAVLGKLDDWREEELERVKSKEKVEN